jgi:hypothetical protein
MTRAALARITMAPLALALAMSACGGTSGSTSSSAPSPHPSTAAAPCVSPPPAIGPDVAGSLGETDTGGSFCLHVGENLSVFLSVPPDQADSGRWTPIEASDGGVLQPVPSGALTLVRGVTAGIFAAVRVGTSRLSSTRPPCTSSAASGCPAGQGWQATIVVAG